MEILLVTMPWSSLDIPSIQLGVLKSIVDDQLPEVKCDNLYVNLMWAEYLYQKSNGEIDRATEYPLVAEGTFAYGVGEWIFTPALYEEEYKRQEFIQFLKEYNVLTDEEIEVVSWMYEQSTEFIHGLIDQIFTKEYDIVGFTSSFMQNIPSLALARLIKQKYPNTKIVFGGANCDGEQGAAMHRNFSFVDYVVRGEGELVFPQLIKAVLFDDQPEFDKITGLCYWDENGKSVANAMTKQPIDFDLVPLPYYDDYFALIDELEVGENIHPQLALETSRGCWWGAKHQCTFCGLNGSFIDFRSKPADRSYDMIYELTNKYKVVDLFMVDNIMDLSYMKELLPRLQKLPWDVSFFYEVKANLLEEHIRLFTESGVNRIQPGIESLSTEVLKLMDKGITGMQNIQLLKYCEQYSVTLRWNILYGFPGEKLEYYDLEKMKFLAHLQPPGAAVRINLERFSPYFEKPELGLHVTGPANFYSLIYKLPREELMDLAYIFESTPEGLQESDASVVRGHINEWQVTYSNTDFNYRQSPDGSLHFYDTRPCATEREFVWSDPLHVAAHSELNVGRNVQILRKKLSQQFVDDPRLAEGDDYLENWLNEMAARGVFYEDDGKYLALAIPYDNQRLRENRYLYFMREVQEA